MTTTLDPDVLRLMATAQDAKHPNRRDRHQAMEALFAELLKYNEQYGFTFQLFGGNKIFAAIPKPWNNATAAVLSCDPENGSCYLAPHSNTGGEGEPTRLALSYDPYLRRFVEETKPDATQPPRSAVYVIIATLTGTTSVSGSAGQ
jgi:hypothetical protein